jgi:Flp pilus assembly protein TadD
MKKEGLMMLVAGVILGAVLGFIGTRQYYLKKTASSPPPAGAAQPRGQEAAGAQGFDPAQHETMLAQIKEELDKNPADVEKRVLLGNIYYDAQKYDEAAPYYEQALKLQPKDANVLVDLGVCYRYQKKYDEALELFDKALAVEPDKKQALFNKAVVLGFDKGEKADARRVLAVLQAKYGDDPVVRQLAEELSK